MTDKQVDAISWCGTASFFIAYFLVSFGFLSAEGIHYQALNIAGALGIGIQAWHKWIKQIICVEIFWIAVGIIAIMRTYLP